MSWFLKIWQLNPLRYVPYLNIHEYWALPPSLTRTFPILCSRSSWTIRKSFGVRVGYFRRRAWTALPDSFMNVVGMHKWRVSLIVYRQYREGWAVAFGFNFSLHSHYMNRAPALCRDWAYRGPGFPNPIITFILKFNKQ